MLVWTAGKSGSSKSSPFFRQLSRSRSNSELITPPCFSSHPPLTRSHSRDSGPLGSAVRAGLVAREVAPEERVAAWHACRCWCQWNPRTGRGRRILGVTSFSCPASNPKLWKFQAPLQGLRVDTSPHTYDRITRTRVAWPGY